MQFRFFFVLTIFSFVIITRAFSTLHFWSAVFINVAKSLIFVASTNFNKITHSTNIPAKVHSTLLRTSSSLRMLRTLWIIMRGHIFCGSFASYLRSESKLFSTMFCMFGSVDSIRSPLFLILIIDSGFMLSVLGPSVLAKRFRVSSDVLASVQLYTSTLYLCGGGFSTAYL